MTKWKEIALENAVVFAPKVKLQKGQPCAFIAMEDLNSTDNFVHSTKVIDFEGQSGAKFSHGHILFARITPCLQNRKIAQAKLGIHKHGFGSTEFLVFDEKPDVSDRNFLLYLLKTDYVVNHAINSMVGASGRQRADWQYFKTIKIPLPPLPMQRQIAAVLGRYDALLQNYQGQVVALEELAQELYREWFVRGRCPGEMAGYEGELPEGWKAVELSSMSAIIQRGITPDYDDDAGEILCLNQRCIRDNKIDYSTGRLQTKNPGKKVIQFGDVLINSTGEGTLGRTAQVYKMPNEPVTVDTHVSIARPADDIPVEFYGFLVINQEDYFVSMALGATGQTELSREAIGRAKVVRPTQEAMLRFSHIVAPIKHKITNLLDQIDVLRATRDALLPRLLSGQLLPSSLPAIA